MLGLRSDFAEGAGTHRDSAEKESWNGLRDCGWRGELGAPPRGAGSLVSSIPLRKDAGDNQIGHDRPWGPWFDETAV